MKILNEKKTINKNQKTLIIHVNRNQRQDGPFLLTNAIDRNIMHSSAHILLNWIGYVVSIPRVYDKLRIDES